MRKIVFQQPPEKGIRKDIARLISWNHVVNVVKKCSTDLQNWYSTRDSSAKISSPEG